MNEHDERLLDAFGSYWRSMGYAASTLANYRYDLRRLAERRSLNECETLDLHAYIGDRSCEVGPAALSNAVRALRAFYRWRASVLDCDDPSKSLKSPRVPETPVKSVSEHEYRSLMSSLGTAEFLDVRDRALIAVMWSTGMRRSEVARIESAHLDLAESVVHVPRTKTGKPRTCGLSDEAVRCLRSYLKRRGGRSTPTLWSNRQGRPLTGDGLRQMLAERCKAAGLRSIGCHEFRRAIAERWLAANGSESLLRYHQGWSSPAMVARYVRKNGQALAVAEHRRLMA